MLIWNFYSHHIRSIISCIDSEYRWLQTYGLRKWEILQKCFTNIFMSICSYSLSVTGSHWFHVCLHCAFSYNLLWSTSHFTYFCSEFWRNLEVFNLKKFSWRNSTNWGMWKLWHTLRLVLEDFLVLHRSLFLPKQNQSSWSEWKHTYLFECKY